MLSFGKSSIVMASLRMTVTEIPRARELGREWISFGSDCGCSGCEHRLGRFRGRLGHDPRYRQENLE